MNLSWCQSGSLPHQIGLLRQQERGSGITLPEASCQSGSLRHQIGFLTQEENIPQRVSIQFTLKASLKFSMSSWSGKTSSTTAGYETQNSTIKDVMDVPNMSTAVANCCCQFFHVKLSEAMTGAEWSRLAPWSRLQNEARAEPARFGAAEPSMSSWKEEGR